MATCTKDLNKKMTTTAELACVYSALILADDDVAVTVRIKLFALEVKSHCMYFVLYPAEEKPSISLVVSEQQFIIRFTLPLIYFFLNSIFFF